MLSMKTYVCDWIDGDETYCVSFDARNWDEAVEKAASKGWTLLAEFVDEDPEIDAVIELRIGEPNLH